MQNCDNTLGLAISSTVMKPPTYKPLHSHLHRAMIDVRVCDGNIREQQSRCKQRRSAGS